MRAKRCARTFLPGSSVCESRRLPGRPASQGYDHPMDSMAWLPGSTYARWERGVADADANVSASLGAGSSGHWGRATTDEVSMKNPRDYEAGWTGKTFNPATGKTPSGGAARNMLVAQAGGASAVYAAGGADALNQIAPLIEQLQNRLLVSETFSEQLVKRLEALQNNPLSRRPR